MPISKKHSKLDSAKNAENFYWLFLGFIILGFFILGLILPYMHDDWRWGTQVGLDRLTSFFKDYNGRYAGNLYVLAMTRSRIVRGVIYALTAFGMTFLAQKIVNYKSDSKTKTLRDVLIVLFVIFLIFCIPPQIAAQTINWTAGFANFVAPLPFMLFSVWIVYKKAMKGDTERDSIPIILVSFLVVLIGQLFVEHITAYVLLILLFANIFFVVKNKKVDRTLVFMLIASVLGAVLMFSNGIYAAAASDTGTSYQNIDFGNGLGELIVTVQKKFTKTIAPLYIMDNTLIGVILCIFGAALLYFGKGKLKVLPSTGLLMIAVYQIVRKMYFRSNIDKLDALVCVVFVLCLAWAIWSVKELRWSGLFLLGSSIVLVAPLTVANPIGPRNFFPIYFMLVILTVQMGHTIISQLKEDEQRKFDKATFKVLALACVSVAVVYLGLISYVAVKYDNRIDNIQQQFDDGKTEIIVKRLPFEIFFQNITPDSEAWYPNFSEFYGFPYEKDVTTYVIEKKK